MDTKKVKSKKIKQEPTPSNSLTFNFGSQSNSETQQIKYTANLTVESLVNVTTYQIYINGLFYGSDSRLIQINNGDTLQIIVQKLTLGEPSSINLGIELI